MQRLNKQVPTQNNKARLLHPVADFIIFQQFMREIATGLRTKFQVNTVSFMGILEDEQRKYASQLKAQKLESIQTMIIKDETWAATKIRESEQFLID